METFDAMHRAPGSEPLRRALPLRLAPADNTDGGTRAGSVSATWPPLDDPPAGLDAAVSVTADADGAFHVAARLLREKLRRHNGRQDGALSELEEREARESAGGGHACRVRRADGVAILLDDDRPGRVRVVDEARGVLEMGLAPSLHGAMRALADAATPLARDALPATCEIECALLVHELLAQGVVEPC